MSVKPIIFGVDMLVVICGIIFFTCIGVPFFHWD